MLSNSVFEYSRDFAILHNIGMESFKLKIYDDIL